MFGFCADVSCFSVEEEVCIQLRGQVGNVDIGNKAKCNKSRSKHAFNCLGAFLTNLCLTLGLASYC